MKRFILKFPNGHQQFWSIDVETAIPAMSQYMLTKGLIKADIWIDGMRVYHINVKRGLVQAIKRGYNRETYVF